MGAQKVLEQLPQGGRYYVTIDIDAFDYSIAGGTGSPMLGGLLYDEAVDLLEGIAQLGEVICVDLVEVSPPYDDAAGTTCYLAAWILADFLGFITKEDVANKLFKEIGPKYADRNGGYTRIVRIGPRRGDAAEMAIIQLV